MNISLDMVLVIQSILCVYAKLNLKPLNISSCVVTFTAPFKNLEKGNPIFISLRARNQVFMLFYGSQTNSSKSLN